MQLVVPLAVLAADISQDPPETTVPNIENLCQLINLITRITNWLLVVLVVLAVIFVIIAAFNYLTAGGDSEKVGEANKKIIYAAVAVAVGLLAKAVPPIVAGILGGGVGECP